MSIADEIIGNAGRYYLYQLSRPLGRPFYVGVGKAKPSGEQRVDFHEREALRGGRSHKCNIIRKINADGHVIGKSVIAWFDSVEAVFAAERAKIREIGRKDLGNGPLCNQNDGGTGQINPSAETLRKKSIAMKANPAVRINGMKSAHFLREWQAENVDLALALARERGLKNGALVRDRYGLDLYKRLGQMAAAANKRIREENPEAAADRDAKLNAAARCFWRKNSEKRVERSKAMAAAAKAFWGANPELATETRSKAGKIGGRRTAAIAKANPEWAARRTFLAASAARQAHKQNAARRQQIKDEYRRHLASGASLPALPSGRESLVVWEDFHASFRVGG